MAEQIPLERRIDSAIMMAEILARQSDAIRDEIGDDRLGRLLVEVRAHLALIRMVCLEPANPCNVVQLRRSRSRRAAAHPMQ